MLGDAWEDLGVLNPSPTGVWSFSYLGNGIVLAGLRGGGLWYKSIDYGKTWIDMGSTPGAESTILALVNVGNGVAVAAMGTNDSDVERSSNWGDSFVFIKELDAMRRSCNSGTYCGNNIVLVGTNGTMWAFANATVHRSIDGGANWDLGQAITTTPFDVCVALEYLSGTIVLAGTTQGEIARSTDRGATWNLNILNIGLGVNAVYDFAHLGGGVVLLCSRLGHIWRSENFGQTWTHIASPSGGGILRKVVYAGAPSGMESMVFTCGPAGHVYRSLNGGYNWTDLGVILPGIVQEIYSMVYCESETERALIVGYHGLAGDARMARTGEAIPQLGIPDNLLCEQKKNPTDVTDPQPEFSAIHHYG